jgi:hypothetical protein
VLDAPPLEAPAPETAPDPALEPPVARPRVSCESSLGVWLQPLNAAVAAMAASVSARRRFRIEPKLTLRESPIITLLAAWFLIFGGGGARARDRF